MSKPEIPSTAKEATKTAFNMWNVVQQKLEKEISVCRPKINEELSANQCMRMISDLETVLKRVKLRFDDFEDAMAAEGLEFENHEKEYWNKRFEAEKLLDHLSTKFDPARVQPQGVTNSSPLSDSAHELKISVPPFYGEMDKWDEFWTLFKELVHDKTQLSYGIKFIHLRNAIKGDAAEVIDGFKPNKEGYHDAIASLKENYDHTKMSQKHLRNMLYGLTPIRHSLTRMI